MTENWKPVVDYEGVYEVSDRGQVRRVLTSAGARAGRVLRPGKSGRYFQYRLSKGGDSRSFLAHRLVLEAHVGPRPEGMVACHNDGDSHNNSVENLRWDTPIANEADKNVHGTINNYWGGRDHCNKGHRYADETTIWVPDYSGELRWRRCKVCVRKNQREYKRRKREERAAANVERIEDDPPRVGDIVREGAWR